jgi:hypothetical protein
MRSNSKLSQGDSKGVHPVVKCVMGSNNESIPHNHEVLCIEGHLRTQSSLRVYPSDMHKLPLDIIFLMIVFISCRVGKRCLGAIREYQNGGSRSIVMPTDARRSETPTYQHREQTRELMDARDSDEW